MSFVEAGCIGSTTNVKGAVLFNLGFAGEKFSLKYIYFRVRQANTWKDKRHFVQDKKHD